MITAKNQRFVAPEHWDAQILRNHPAFQWLCALLPLLQQDDFPTPDMLTQWCQAAQPQNPMVFIDVAEMRDDPRYYEVFIAQTGSIPTRRHNWHDLFGALIWILFPQSKLALNRRHLAEIELHGTKTRSPLRHQLTLFDECGLLLLHTQAMAAHPDSLRQHLWTEVFMQHKEEWERELWPLVFGHANYEMLTRPFIGLTAKLWPLLVPDAFVNWSLQQRIQFVDTALSKQIEAFTLTDYRQQMSPLPLLGIPGWYAGSQTAEFYQDQNYFRPKRVLGDAGQKGN